MARDGDKTRAELREELRLLRRELERLEGETAARDEMETELRRAELRYRTLVDNAPVGIWHAAVDGSGGYINPKLAEIAGLSLEEAQGQGWANALHPEDREQVFAAWDAFTKGEAEYSLTYRFRKQDGEVRWVIGNATPIVDTDGQVLGFIGTLTDITTLKRSEQELLKLEKLESLGVLAGGIAHDFNNLLTGLFGNIEMARQSLSSDDEAHEFLGHAGRSLDSATSLTKQLLTFAKGSDPIKEVITLGPLVTETAQFLLRGSTVKLNASIDPNLWPIEADKGQLGQAISNVVINAHQAMTAGGTITITGENVRLPKARRVRVRVHDEGSGIPEEYLDKVFDPYFSTKEGGSGLGLASAHSIITEHDGTISVHSQPGRGTTVAIELPAARKAAARAPRAPAGEDRADGIAPARVLVMDDQEEVRRILGAMLERLGGRVSFAVDGNEAVARFREAQESDAPYDVVITDLTIPGGMGGQEAAQEILKLDDDARIIATSGYATDPVLAKYREYGFAGIVVKPCGLEDLRQAVRRVLEG